MSYIMASEVKVAKTLSKGSQKKSLKGGKKVKKNVIKNTLDNPFALEWPSIGPELEEEVRVLLRKSCSGLKKIVCRPPWKEVKKYKGTERSVFLEKFKQQFQENLDPNSMRQSQETDEALSHVVFGYNAVMRALEKDSIAGIIVKKNVKPSFVVKTFLPGCANKCIPLFPLNDLDSLLKNENCLALPHSCMVLGLKPSVREDGNRFHALYVKICEAVEIDVEVNDGSEEEDEEEVVNMEQREENLTADNDKQKSSHSLSKEEIKSFHLKRTDPSKRVFVPGGETEQNSTTADFISFGSSEEVPCPPLERKQLVDRSSQRGTVDKPKGKTVVQNELQTNKYVDFSNLFLIDQEGDGNCMTENVKGKTAGGTIKEHSNKKNVQKKKKRKIMNDGSYVPAKAKKLKGNPNRKCNTQT